MNYQMDNPKDVTTLQITRNELIDLLLKHGSHKAVAAELNVTDNQFAFLMRRNNLTGRDTYWDLLAKSKEYKNEKDMIRKLYKRFESLRRMAEYLNVTANCLRARMMTLGIKRNSQGGSNRKALHVGARGKHEGPIRKEKNMEKDYVMEGRSINQALP